MNAQGKIAKVAAAAQPTVKVITGSKAIMAEIRSFGEDARTMQYRLHVLACSVLAHVGRNGDKRPVAAMLAEFDRQVPDMVKQNALRSWLETFGKITFTDGVPGYDGSKTQRLGEAMEKPFWKFKSVEGVKYVPLKIDAFIESNCKKLREDIAKAPWTDEKTVDPRAALITALLAAKAVQQVQSIN